MKCFFPFKSRESKSTSELQNRNKPAQDRRAKSSSSVSSPLPPPPPPPPNIQQMYRERGQNLREFSFSELRAATNGFSKLLKIGEGGFGSVYKGTIGALDGRDHPTVVAIKKLNKHGLQGHKQWLTEVQFLGIVEHPNLVKLLGYCSIDRERGLQRLLVYEYMPNKSLEDHLFARTSSTLTWKTRLDIILGAARGLAYLHEGLEVQVIFRDFKPSNVLLDEDFKPKLSDFGLAREGPIGDRSHVSTDVVGTIGYAAPEYVNTGHLTLKSDIYSFGVVLYEILTGRRTIERFRPTKEQKLLDWVKDFPVHSNMFSMIIDPQIRNQCPLTSASKIAMLADCCLNKMPKDRPMMQEVVKNLEEIVLQDSELGGSSEISPNKRLLAHKMGAEDMGRKPTPLPQPRDTSVRVSKIKL